MIFLSVTTKNFLRRFQMMKRFTKILCAALIAVTLSMAAIALVGCGNTENNNAGYYGKFVYEVTGQEFLDLGTNGDYCASENTVLRDTLTLLPDGTYSLEKYMTVHKTHTETTTGGYHFIIFYGTYEKNGNEVTLKIPTEYTYHEDTIYGAGRADLSGKQSKSEGFGGYRQSVDEINSQTRWYKNYKPVYEFNGPSFSINVDVADQKVTIDETTKKLTFVVDEE